MNKEETQIHKLIGRIGEEYYFCDYVFKDKNFKGATGTLMHPVTAEEAEELRDNWDKDGELWQEAVANKQTTLGQDDWKKQILYIGDDSVVFDLSYADTYGGKLLDKLGRDNYELVECIGGGRCFKVDMAWDELFDAETWELIKQYESQ